jgi:hypothetical protein
VSERASAKLLPALALAATVLGVAAAPASATFHEVFVRELYPGSAAEPEAEYVELQMWASGQEFVKSHSVGIYGPGGAPTGTAKFTDQVPNGANQSTILIATPQAGAAFGVTPDLTMAAAIDPAGGAVCWEGLDCVSWGPFAGGLPSAAGPPAVPAGIPDGKALRRSIARGCASLAEPGDDTDNSAADLEAVFPAPRPNSTPPTEKACGGGGGKGGGGGGEGNGAPQTSLRKKPPKRTVDRTPSFRFSSGEDRASFQCKLDRGRFKACRSPFTSKRLPLGPHTFRVRAKDSSGEVDPSPASYRFTVIRKKR